MTRFRYPAFLILAATAAIPLGGARASDIEDTPYVATLSAEQKAAIQSDATEAKTDAAMARALGGGGPDRQIHGEMSVMVGTGGARGIAGTAAIPLGDSGGAIISIANYKSPRLRW